MVESVEGADVKTHLSVQKYLDMPEGRRRSLTVGPGLLTEDQYNAAIAVAKQLPLFEISKAFFKVVGERVVTPSSLVQLVIKGRIVPPGSTGVPEVNEKDLEDIDPDETDVNAIIGRKGATKQSGRSGDGNDADRVQPPLAHAPYLPRDHPPRWHIFLADAKQGKIAVPPFTFTTFDKPIFDEQGKPTFNMQTLKMQFQAPPQVGNFSFVLHMISDSYMGFDVKQEITLQVEDPSKAAVLQEEDDISEPDEGKSFPVAANLPPFPLH